MKTTELLLSYQKSRNSLRQRITKCFPSQFTLQPLTHSPPHITNRARRRQDVFNLKLYERYLDFIFRCEHRMDI